MVVCLERSAHLHTAQLMPLPLTVSCFSEIQIGFAFLVPAHPGSPGQRAVRWVCVCVCVLCLPRFHSTVLTAHVTVCSVPQRLGTRLDWRHIRSLSSFRRLTRHGILSAISPVRFAVTVALFAIIVTPAVVYMLRWKTRCYTIDILFIDAARAVCRAVSM